jgi:hypothetical protein
VLSEHYAQVGEAVRGGIGVFYSTIPRRVHFRVAPFNFTRATPVFPIFCLSLLSLVAYPDFTMAGLPPVYIVSVARTPVGSFLG